MFRISINLLMSFLFLCVPVYAQQAQKEAAKPTTPAAEQQQEQQITKKMAEEPEVAPQEKLKDGMVSLNFRDVDIKDVLRVLAYESNMNIVAGPEVTGLVTIQLDNVPWKRALDVVVDTYGYAYDQRDKIITVTTVENLKKRREDAMLLTEQEPLVTKAFVLNYAKASDVIVSIQKMKTQRGSVNYDERTNSVIVRDISSNLEMIGNVIKQLDKTTPQVLIEAKIIETTLGNTEKLGIDWTATVQANGALWPTSWPLHKDGTSKAFFDNTDADPSSVFTYGTLDFTTFQAILNVLNSRTDTNTISNPKIVTLNNKQAKIVVGSQYPFPDYTYNQDQAQMQVSGWKYKDIGVIFEVTPHVNNAGMVTLDILPQITAIDGFVQVDQHASTLVPKLTKREANTSVMIKTGETLVIGGLISDTETDINSKVPLLGDIPLVGRLFRHSSKVKAKTDLLIFLTPHIITSNEQSDK